MHLCDQPEVGTLLLCVLSKQPLLATAACAAATDPISVHPDVARSTGPSNATSRCHDASTAQCGCPRLRLPPCCVFEGPGVVPCCALLFGPACCWPVTTERHWPTLLGSSTQAINSCRREPSVRYRWPTCAGAQGGGAHHQQQRLSVRRTLQVACSRPRQLSSPLAGRGWAAGYKLQYSCSFAC
jgi:hypothetical protein